MHRVGLAVPRICSLTTVRRRVYHSEGVNHVWHIDGNHKLIRWRMVIHGGIDGSSRLIVYMKCTTNNAASTVLSLFEAAISAYGCPQSIRSDLGGEMWMCGATCSNCMETHRLSSLALPHTMKE